MAGKQDRVTAWTRRGKLGSCGSGLIGPWGLAYDGRGNLWAANLWGSPGTVTEIPIDVLHKMTHGVYGTALSAADIQPVIDVAAKYQMLERAFPAQELIDAGAGAR